MINLNYRVLLLSSLLSVFTIACYYPLLLLITLFKYLACLFFYIMPIPILLTLLFLTTILMIGLELSAFLSISIVFVPVLMPRLSAFPFASTILMLMPELFIFLFISTMFRLILRLFVFLFAFISVIFVPGLSALLSRLFAHPFLSAIFRPKLYFLLFSIWFFL